MLTTRSERRLAGAAIGLGVLVAGILGAVPARAVTSGSPPELFPNSPFDHSVAGRPLASASVALVAHLDEQIQVFSSGNVGVNSLPIFTVSASQPSLPVTVQTRCKDFVNGIPGGTGPVPIPSNAYTAGGPDRTMDVYQPSSDTGWELWKVAAPGTSQSAWSACWGGSLHPSQSSGVFPGHYGSSASGLSYLATAITEQDVASGQIAHALAFQIPQCNGHTAPADRNDSTGCGVAGAPPEGTWFRMPGSVQMPTNLTPLAQMVFRALQTYGVVVFDHAGTVMIQAEDTADWAFEGNSGANPMISAFGTTNGQVNSEWTVLSGIPWASLQVICAPGVGSSCLD